MRRFVSLLVVIAIMASGCGSSDSDGSTTEARGQTPATTAATTTFASEPSSTADAPELGGTDWVVTNYSQASGTITNVWLTEVTITFAEDGIVSGTAGCNDYQGTWTVAGPYDEFESGVPDANDGQELAFGSLSWTEVACEDEDIMEQEGEILELLQRAGRWVLIRDAFHLRDAEGAFLFETESA